MRIVHEWLSELARIPDDVETVAREISLRGFEVAGVEDGVIDFEVTANRPDCLSHVGFAREAQTIWSPGSPAGVMMFESPGAATHTESPQVAVEAPDLCPRYAAQVFHVEVGPSPGWLATRLERAGVRPINNIVDVTNYVMLEIGHPMHAFDLERLAGGRIVVRRARAGEKLITLDGVERTLDPEMLVIADADRPVAVAGVMGGRDSEIGPSTKRVLLESAYFQPASVRRTSKRLGLKTDASTRFERGADIEGPLAALARAASLLRVMSGGVRGAVADAYPSPRQPARLTLRASRIQRVLGIAVPAADVPRILTPLGFDAAPSGDGAWTVTVPSFRVDVTREVDLIEEVGRHFGFDRLPVTFPTLTGAQPAPDARLERDKRIRAILTAAGLSESITFAFIERAAAEPFAGPDLPAAALANPLSEKFAVLRPSMLPGLVDSAAHNRRRGRKDVRLFELGSRFGATGEGRSVGLVWTGAGHAAHWSATTRPVDFFDIKGVTELLCTALDLHDAEIAAANAPYLVPGRAAEVRSGAVLIGVLGQVLPAIIEARGFPPGEELYAAEIDLDAAASRMPGGELRAQPLPKFPPIVRDLSILVGEALPAAAVRGTIRSAAPQTLQSIAEFDRYQGKGIPEGRVSLSLRLTFRSPERTLTDEEVDIAMTSIVETLHREHGAERR